ncbi:MAG: putative membrane protein insertion efficiency factor [Chlamydiia bacterium]|nr:putative membrane protein insertion efficiency factor [Chlamydiia bacterium]MCH9618841.1 putative membrane protein insertion efficiency factor [Chlamydiia bacterium]MCH9624357.1 putative membrane protein insertion efficiency factor [Chlamydiia bacterium]
MVFKTFPIILCSMHLLAAPGYHLPWGKDTDMIKRKSFWIAPKKRYDPLGKVSEKIILFHQNVLSPVDGPRSHFRPTSSRYMLLAIRRYGFIKGSLKGFDRLLRENSDPWVYRTREIDGVKYKWDPTY